MEERSYDHIDNIPSYFLCPISMQLMKDPVTLSSGITYDRQNIEKWLFSLNHTTCPLTNQHISNPHDLTPNHTLRRLLQAWCTLNALDRIPTPKAPLHIIQIINAAKTSPTALTNCLRTLQSIAEGSQNQLRGSGAAEFLTSIVRRGGDDAVSALDILRRMELSDSDLKKFSADESLQDSLIHVLETGTHQSRAHAIALLKSALGVADPDRLIGSRPGLFKQVTRVVADRISAQATKWALKLLVEVCPWGRNRIKAVEGGAVPVLTELLLETGERRACELALTILDQLCGCAEGRAELLGHGAGLAVVSKKIHRVSHVASERGVRIISSISRHSVGNGRVVEEMLEVGVVAKLCLVLQVGSSEKMKERAKEILRMHSRVWKNSSCIPSQLASSYPSS